MRIALTFLCAIFLLAPHGHAATEIPFVYRDGLIWVKAQANGQSLNFLLDSGAGTTVLDLRAAQRLGLKLGSRQAVQGVEGKASAYRVNGFTASIGGAAVASPELAMDLSGPSACCQQRVDGLIGADFFRSRIVQINFAAQKIRLLQRDEEGQAVGEIIPLAARNDALCACISINGNAEYLRVDTGCSSALEWVVTSARAKTLGLRTIGLNSGSVPEIHTDVQLASKRIPGVRTGIHTEQMFSRENGLIGNGLLSRFTVTIDVAKRRCLLSSR